MSNSEWNRRFEENITSTSTNHFFDEVERDSGVQFQWRLNQIKLKQWRSNKTTEYDILININNYDIVTTLQSKT